MLPSSRSASRWTATTSTSRHVAPDEGLSAPFNSWFTLFGQFFDHGLDLVNKGGSGTVFIPLQPDDPLYVPGSHDQLHGADARHGHARRGRRDRHRGRRPAGQHHDVLSSTRTRPTPRIPRTRSSCASMCWTRRRPGRDRQADRGRQWRHGDLGRGQGPGQLMLGIQLTDQRRRQACRCCDRSVRQFIPGAQRLSRRSITGIGADGIPNTADDIVVSATPPLPVQSDYATAIRTTRVPGRHRPRGRSERRSPTATSDRPGQSGQRRSPMYDNELLDAHFIAGDGRVNENIGLTAVHHVFHAEHNRLVEHTKDSGAGRRATMLADGASRPKPWRSSTNGCADDVTHRAGRDRRVWSGTASACSRRRSSAPRCSISISCSRNSPARSSRNQRLPGSRRLRHHHRSVDRGRVRACGVSLRPLDADRDDRPFRPDFHRRPHRPDRGLPQSDRSSTAMNGSARSTTTSRPAPSSAA